MIPVCLAALTLSVFARSLGNDFVYWDDNRNIYHNPQLDHESLAGAADFWTRPYAGMYIPVTYTAWSLLARASGLKDSGELQMGAVLNPVLFHAANIFVHLGCVFLVYALIRLLLPGEDRVSAALGAALFAVHPFQVEPVAWATGLKDVLSTFLGLLSILLYLIASPQENPRRDANRWLYIASLASFLLALLSKPAIVTVPALIALLELGLRHSPVKLTIRRLAPFLAASLAVIGLTMAIQYQPWLAFPPAEIALWKRPVVALDTAAFYLARLVFPWHLAPDYGRTPLEALRLNSAAPLWTLTFLLGFLIFLLKNNRRFYAIAFGFALLALAPVSGLITFAYQGISTVADRYMYLPMAGIALAAAGFLTFFRKPWLRVAFVQVLIILALISAVQTGHWKKTSTLFAHTLRVNPRSVIAHYNLAIVLADNGSPDQAISHYERAIALDPGFPFPYNNLGRLLNDKNDFAAAEPLFLKAITLTPGDPLPYRNLAYSLARRSRFAEAAAHYEHAVSLKPGDPAIMTELAYSLANSRRFEEAVTWFRKTLDVAPALAPAYEGLGKACLELQRTDEAAAAFEELVKLGDEDPWSHKLLADAYVSAGDTQRARAIVDRALALARKSPDYPAERTRRIEQDRDRLRNGP